MHISDLDRPLLDRLFRSFVEGVKDSSFSLELDGRNWFGSIAPLAVAGESSDLSSQLYLAALVPERELLLELERVRWHSVLISLAVLAISLLLAWRISKSVSSPASALAAEAVKIGQLKLDTPITTRSRITEIEELATTMATMKTTLWRYTEIAKALSLERDLDKLLEMIARESSAAAAAESAVIWLMDERANTLAIAPISSSSTTVPLYGQSGAARLDHAEVYAALNGETLVVNNVETETRFPSVGCRPDGSVPGAVCRSLMLVPLLSRQGEVIGLLELTNATTPGGFRPEIVSYVEALASSAALALDNQYLLKAHDELFEAMIRLLAAAIDAKSPYTGGHCQRVPALTELLAEAANSSDAPPFRQYRLDAAARRELHVASWLHDCGKVTRLSMLLIRPLSLRRPTIACTKFVCGLRYCGGMRRSTICRHLRKRKAARRRTFTSSPPALRRSVPILSSLPNVILAAKL